MKFKDLKNAYFLGDNFKKYFGDIEFKIPKRLKLQSRILERSMLDREILDEFKPQESNLGELAWAIQNSQKANLVENGYANIFYIRDKNNTLWAVVALWYVGDGWYFEAYSVEDPGRWDEGCQVLSQAFGKLESGNLKPLENRVRELELFKERVEKILRI